ncbi:MAG: hypothetical protein EBU08_16940 [Micrococcales bacterium]|jgi:hypothetical protein|nr:hypothetical protein [Micrococcales bacterium]
MKISQDTLTVLKNFSTINSNLIVLSGSTIKTISPTKNIMVEAEVTEDFPIEFCIWDLSKFLATVSMFKDPHFQFEDNYVIISSEGSRAKVRYYYSNSEMLDGQILEIIRGGKSFTMPESVVDFTLDAKDFTELQKAAAVLAAPDLALRNNNDRLTMNVFDRKDSTGHTYSIDVGEYDGVDSFEFMFKAENLKMVPGTYTVKVSDKKVSEFRNKNGTMTYWISLETDSKFTKSKKKSNVAVG